MPYPVLRLLSVQLLALTIGLGLSLPCYSQSKDASAMKQYAAADYDELLRLFKRRGYRSDTLLPLPVIYRDSVYSAAAIRRKKLQFEVRLAEQPLRLQRQAIQLRNPFGDWEHPISYSVIYRHCLVVLFAPGKFACYQLLDLRRNELLEQQLNTQSFEQHWTLNQQLIGWRNKQAYAYDTTRQEWQPTTQPLPFAKQPKLFEDERFACSMMCNGEFGGILYFYDKQTHLTHYVDATCGTSVWKQGGQYQVLASLAHMQGSASSAIIPAPEELPLVSKPRIAEQDWQYHFPSSVPSPAVHPTFRYYGLIMLGAFQWHNQTLFLVDWRGATFLATVTNNQITIVDPLFNNSLTHTALTTSYAPNQSLTSLLRYENRHDNEAACLLIDTERVIKIEWGK